jgi:hypothetical protein
MQGEVKITVIATGFGRKRAAMQQASSTTDSTTIEYTRPVVESRPVMPSEEDDLNIPAFLRNRI